MKKHLASDEISKHGLVRVLQSFAINDPRDNTRKLPMAMKLLFPYDKREPLKDIGVAFKEYIRHEGSGQEYNVTDSNFKAL